MKLEITHTEKVEVDIELPYFSSNNCTAYKIIDKNKAIQVSFASTEIGIFITPYYQSCFLKSCAHSQITEEKFNELYNEVKKLL